jgi:1-phosphofructokinase/tagatose 6-phosphate kinase
MFVTLCLNPTIQKTLVFEKFHHAEVNRAKESFTDISGKGVNVSRVLAQLKKPVLHITQLTKEEKSFFKRELKKQKIELFSIKTAAKARICTTIIEENMSKNDNIVRSITELVENGNKVEPKTEIHLKKNFDKLLKKAKNNFKIDAFVISGSKAPGFNDSLFAELALKAHANKILTVLDIRGADLKELLNALRNNPIKADETPIIIKPNVLELKETFFANQAENSSEFFEERIKFLLMDIFEQYGILSIITRGKNSTLAFDGKNFIVMPSKKLNPAKIINTIGCGDSFTAGFVAAMSECKNFIESLKQGVECASLNALTIRPGSIF